MLLLSRIIFLRFDWLFLTLKFPYKLKNKTKKLKKTLIFINYQLP